MPREARYRLVLALGFIAGCGTSQAGGVGSSEAGAPSTDGSTSETFDGGFDATVIVEAGSPSDGASPDSAIAAPTSTPVQPLLNGTGFYPRAILRPAGNILASVVAPQASGRLGASILESMDDGLTFAVVGNVDDARAAGGLCCGTLYQLPGPVGTLPTGALLWAASVGQNDASTAMSIPIWDSTDEGRSWAYLSTVVTTAAPRTGGIWEPEFSRLPDGTLVCYYSDETDPAHSQKLTSRRSTDGVSWSDATDVVALSVQGERPGMANVRERGDAGYFMSYEVCGVPDDDCTVHLRTSPDGSGWGAPTDAGFRPATADGRVFRHAPTLAFESGGDFVLVGQMVYEADGGVAPANGSVLFENKTPVAGSWGTVAAPVPVPDSFNNFCPNYSSTILPLDNGTVALEIASKVVGTDCRPFYARGPLIGVSADAGQ